MPKISVIMGTYNGSKTISRAINSILIQSFSDFELIICDDYSKDDTTQIVERFAKKDSRIKLIRNRENLGLAASLNKCIDISNGIYIARMDDDDISHSDRFERQNSFLDKHPEYAIVGSCRRTFDDEGVWNNYGKAGGLTKEDIIKGNIFTHPTVMIRKKALVESGMYTVSERTIRGQDFDLWCKMYAQGFIGYVMEDILFDYYEDRNRIKEIDAKFRINNFNTHMMWRKKMNLSLWYDVYAYKELLAILIPQKLLVRYKKKMHKNQDKNSADDKSK